MDPQPNDEEKKNHKMKADKKCPSYSELTVGDQKEQKTMGKYSGNKNFRLSLLTSFQFIQLEYFCDNGDFVIIYILNLSILFIKLFNTHHILGYSANIFRMVLYVMGIQDRLMTIRIVDMMRIRH